MFLFSFIFYTNYDEEKKSLLPDVKKGVSLLIDGTEESGRKRGEVRFQGIA